MYIIHQPLFVLNVCNTLDEAISHIEEMLECEAKKTEVINTGPSAATLYSVRTIPHKEVYITDFPDLVVHHINPHEEVYELNQSDED